MKKFIKIYILTILALTGVSLSSCTEDPLVAGGESVVDGEPATIGLRVTVDDMSQFSRAGESDSNVESLWVAIYNAKTGDCTFRGPVGESNNGEVQEVIYDMDKIDCKSGESYIVAVANYHGVKAITLENQNKEEDLEVLLEAADTWDKFRSIIYRRVMIDDTDISITMPSFGMPMSGSYRTSKEHDHNDAIDVVNIKPGTNGKLDGVIHLRRILAHNTLNIEKSGNVIDLEVLDIEVFNLPKYTWMHSRTPEVTPTDKVEMANAGDAMDPNGTAVDNPHYVTSLRYTPPAEITVKNGVYSFDFYQFENKRTGTAKDYYEREKEIKENNLNTGRYESLVSVSELNNNATYVKIKARLTYKSPGTNLDNPDGIIVGDGGLPNSAASRTAEVTYVVHLGYAKEKLANGQYTTADPKDFNCRRNAHYTYNITVEKVNKIIVEAFVDNEGQPGAEGTVTDVTDKMFDLDAHFGVFNIGLTAEEINSFKFTMRTYDSGAAKEIYDLGDNNNNIPKSQNDANWKYYDWIEVLPTTGENVIAQYPGYGNKEIIYLGDLNSYTPTNLDKNGVQWFTVYVNEYTYEERNTTNSKWGYESTNWQGYVNQPNRQAWFNVAMRQSSDKESTYFQSKYALTQKSIQTYYDYGSGATCNTALGLEHDNETLGMNLRWLTTDLDTDPDNGRYNVGYAVGLVTGSKNSNYWDSYISRTTIQQINSISNTDQTKLASQLETGERIEYVLKQNEITSNLNTGHSGYYDGTASYVDPQTTHSDAQYVESIYACLNRNRDENGNGMIDASELKWYLPASGKYVRAILGRNSLSTPLMDYAQPTLPFNSGSGKNTLYHYIASDNKIIWADEGMSASDFRVGGELKVSNFAPWQIRCVRNLGTDLTGVSKGEKIEPAYRATAKTGTEPDGYYQNKKTKGGIVRPLHYYGSALREPVQTPIALHKTNDPENKLARYGFEYAPIGNVFYDNEDNYAWVDETKVNESYHYWADKKYTYAERFEYYRQAVASASVCSDLNGNSGRKGWRLPTQKEIVIMRRAGVVSSGGYYMSCTQEYWSTDATNAQSGLTDLSKYRITTVTGTHATAQPFENITDIRCVRDLTAAEANKSYDEVKAYKTN